MRQVAVLSDYNETQNEDDEIFFISVTKKVRVFYIRLKLPDENEKYFKYHTSPADTGMINSGVNLSHAINDLGNLFSSTGSSNSGASGNPSERRRETILGKIDDLSLQGFHVPEKYVSLFISGKIKELILSRNFRSNKSKDRQSKSTASNIEKIESQSPTDGIEDSPMMKILKKYNQNLK